MAGHAWLTYESETERTSFGRVFKDLRKSEMPKLKTKSSAKKRFRLSGTGKVKSGHAYKRHMLRRRSQKMKRNARGTMILADQDAKLVLAYMPYAK